MAGDDSVPILVRLPKKTRPEEPKSSEQPLKKQKAGEQKHKKDKKDKKKHAHSGDKSHREGEKIHKDGEKEKKEKKRSREGTEEGPPKKKKRSKEKKERAGGEDAKPSNNENQIGDGKFTNGSHSVTRRDVGEVGQETKAGGVLKTPAKPKPSVPPSGDSGAKSKKLKAEPTAVGHTGSGGSKLSGERQGQDSEQEDPPPSAAAMEDIISRLQKKDTYLIFAEPVDAEQVPDYYDVIKNPMDFTTMRKRLSRGLYRTWDDFQAHVELMFDNAQKYNSPDTIFYKTAKSMQEASRKMIDAARGALGAGQRKRQVASKFKEEPASEPKKKLSGWGGRRIKGQKLKAIPGVDQLIQKGLSYDELARLGGKQTGGKIGGKAGDEGKQTWSDANDGEDVPGYKKTKEFWGPRDGRLPLGSAEYKRSSYRPRELHILGHGPKPSAPGGESHVLVPTGWHPPYAYARSLCRFAANLPDPVWDKVVASVQKVLPPGVKFGRGWVGEEERPCGGQPKPPEPTVLLSTVVKIGPGILPSPGAKPEALLAGGSGVAKPEAGGSLATAATTGPSAGATPVVAGVNAPSGVNVPPGLHAPSFVNAPPGANAPPIVKAPPGVNAPPGVIAPFSGNAPPGLNAPPGGNAPPGVNVPPGVNAPLGGATTQAQPPINQSVPPLVVPSAAANMVTAEDKPIGVAFGTSPRGLSPTQTGRPQSASGLRPDAGVKSGAAGVPEGSEEPPTNTPVTRQSDSLAKASESGPLLAATSATVLEDTSPTAATSAALGESSLLAAATLAGPSGSGQPAAATSAVPPQSSPPVGATSAARTLVPNSTESAHTSLSSPVPQAWPLDAVPSQIGSADVSIPHVTSAPTSVDVSIPRATSAPTSADVSIPRETPVESSGDVVEAAATLGLNVPTTGVGGERPVSEQPGEKVLPFAEPANVGGLTIGDIAGEARDSPLPFSQPANVQVTSEGGTADEAGRGLTSEDLKGGELGGREKGSAWDDRPAPEKRVERDGEARDDTDGIDGQLDVTNRPHGGMDGESAQAVDEALLDQADRGSAPGVSFEPEEPVASPRWDQASPWGTTSPVAGRKEKEAVEITPGRDGEASLGERDTSEARAGRGDGSEGVEERGPHGKGVGLEGGLAAPEEVSARGAEDIDGGDETTGKVVGGEESMRGDSAAGEKETGSERGGGQFAADTEGGGTPTADGLVRQGGAEPEDQQKPSLEEPAVQAVGQPSIETSAFGSEGGFVDATGTAMLHAEPQLPLPVSKSPGAEEGALKPRLASLTLAPRGPPNEEAKALIEDPSTPNVPSAHKSLTLGSPLAALRARSPSPSTVSPGSSRAVSLERGASADPPVGFGSPLSVQSFRGSSLAPMSQRSGSVNRERSSSLDVPDNAGRESGH